jgi:ABC-type branched-subunit amino acid transport system permease subunit
MGLVLTYKTSGILNFAHGATCAAAAYTFYELHQQHSWSAPLAAAVTLILFGVVGGLVFERFAGVLAGVTVAYRIVGTIGLLVAIQSIVQLAFGAGALTITSIVSQHEVFNISGVSVTDENVVDFVIGIAAAAALYFTFERTRLGMEMRAVVDNPDLLDLTGRSPTVVRRFSWIIGSFFAAASGILLASVQGQIDINVLSLLVVAAFGAAAIGRFTSLPMTFAGGIVVGLLQELTSKEVSVHPVLQGLDINVPFLVLFVVLLVIPARKLVEVGRHVKARALPAPMLSGPTRLAAAAIAVVAVCIVPATVGPKLPIWSLAASQVVLFASLALLVRTSGQISLCHMAFAAIGAAGAGHALSAHVPWGLAVLFGGLLCIPAAAAISVPAIRLSGVYVGLATLGFGILVAQYAYGKSWFFGPQLSVPRPQVLGFDGDKPYYFLLVAIACLVLGVIWLVEHSRLGRLLRALADEPIALTTLGTDINVTKVMVFCVAGFFAGVSGATYASLFGSVSASSFSYIQSLLMLAVLAVAGQRTLVAAVLAPLLLTVLPAYLPRGDATLWLQVSFGVVAMLAAGLSNVSLDEYFARLAERSSGRLVGPASIRIAVAGERVVQ